MTRLNTLKPADGSTFKAKRIGRGSGSGWGCTAGKGNNGSKARSGDRERFYFEGGQTPHTRRLPKRGFNNKQFKLTYQIVNIGDLASAISDEKVVDTMWLLERGLIYNSVEPVKILGNGDFSKSVSIKANAFSATALAKIEAANGVAEVVGRA